MLLPRPLLGLIVLVLLVGCSPGSNVGRPLRYDLIEASGCNLVATPVPLPDATAARIQPMEAPLATIGTAPYTIPYYGYLVDDLAFALLEGEAKAATAQLQEAEARRRITCGALKVSEEARERQKAIAERQAEQIRWLQIGGAGLAIMATGVAAVAVVK